MPEITEKKMKHLMVHVITAARIVYERHWKISDIPTREVLDKTLDVAEMDILAQAMKDKHDQTIRDSTAKCL